MTCKGKGASVGIGCLAEMARSNWWSGSVEVSRASCVKSTSSMIHNYSIKLVKRGLPCASKNRATLFLCLVGISAKGSLSASISPRRTAARCSTTASEIL